MQLGGGIRQGLLEPVAWSLGLLLAGTIAGRGGAQEITTQRRTGAQPRNVQRRGEHRPPIRAGGLGVFPAGDQLRRGGQGLRQPVPGRLQRDPQPRVPGRGSPGPVLLGFAERRGDADDLGQVQHLAFPRCADRRCRVRARWYRRRTAPATACQ